MKLKTRAEAEKAVVRFRKAKEEFIVLKKNMKELDKAQTVEEKVMAGWNTPISRKNSAQKVIKKLNDAWLKGNDKKAELRDEMVAINKAVITFKASPAYKKK